MPQPPVGGPPPYFPPPPGYGGYPPPPFGPPPPQPPRKPNLLPWLIVAGAVLISGLGIALVVLLTGDDSADRQAAVSTSAAPSSSSSATPSRQNDTAQLPGGARVAEPADDSGGRFAGSGDVALTWVQAMADGDFQTAYDLSCTDVQASSDAAADEEGPAQALGTYFYDITLGGETFSGGTFDGVEYDDVSGTDLASFTLDMDSGEDFLLLVYVDADGAVCDFF
jgi:hypothetical protein